VPRTTADPLLLQKEAAEQLRVKEKTLEAWRRLGGGPAFIRKGQRYVRYRQSAIDAWLEERAAATDSQAPPAA
jgi:predicted DNA-binding transcriptional regulator AlpA